MRFTLMTGLGGIEDYPDIARTAEQAGWTSLAIPDSLFYPEVTESDYPYLSTEAVREALDGVPVLDPIVAMTAMAVGTSTLRFYPAVLKVPVRQPLVLAKALASLAVISNNRIALGAGLSPWQEDFSYNGIPFDERGKRMDDCIAIIRGAMSGEYFEYHSDYYDIGRMKLSPVPTAPLPILVGGHAVPALRRAARSGDGWISANSDYESLQQMIGKLNELRREFGTDTRSDFEIHAFDMHASELDDYRRLAELGVTDICVSPWNPYDPSLDRAKKLARIEQFAEAIIQRWPGTS
ncbi:MAG: TIGR03619 family F420-dependent LLM class oxidoreductase [Halioglobus sp.]|nr:TIGR03619 family F420-dependent LLM class oxidoreductase [Halioglobus sp.]MCB1708456.1 TIGR03619 family F420-dependent LLM class oxidoreductase [Halioglobus sp.]MCP5121939.1 TIGR03619 family F420-dependent LLM class oxidoreductase [Pseudomonadales bacterium]MCP5192522.1 TIGR03619 family F420-dependent LLM class oxidoreductase [Pseudomonadales bacterium]